jgi:hypothetical protein
MIPKRLSAQSVRPHYDAALDAHQQVELALVALLVDDRPHHRAAAVSAAKEVIRNLMTQEPVQPRRNQPHRA